MSKPKTVMVFGAFDYLHFGHVRFFEYAKTLGEHLIIVVGRDATVQNVKGKKTRSAEQARITAVRALGMAHAVVLGHKTDRLARIKQYKPDVVCLGYDQRVFVDVLSKYIQKNKLSTHIVRAPAYKPLQHKSSFLKKPVPLVRGIVGTGLGEGKKLGFPTANVGAPAQARKALAPGIYAARVLLDNREYLGAAAVGVRTDKNAPLVEVHVIGLHKNLYGKTITVALDKRLRESKSYKNTHLLIAAIQKDVQNTVQFYKNE